MPGHFILQYVKVVIYPVSHPYGEAWECHPGLFLELNF